MSSGNRSSPWTWRRAKTCGGGLPKPQHLPIECGDLLCVALAEAGIAALDPVTGELVEVGQEFSIVVG